MTPIPPPPPHVAIPFVAALAAAAPAPQGADADLYDVLLGDWDAEVVDHLSDGTDRRQSAEIHFARVLEGRAVQDLWIAPALRERDAPGSAPGPGNRYGTTLRVYDPKSGTWRITWWNPVTGIENRLVGRRVGSRIVHTGQEGERLIRWSFVEVTPGRFHWTGESSADGGQTWVCETEFFGRRRATAGAGPSEVSVQWEWVDRPGQEGLRLEQNGTGRTARGDILVLLDGTPASIHYVIEHDAAWRFRSARIETGPRSARRVLELKRSEEGRWIVDGERRPDLDGCEDVDLMASPYTNTPPLMARPIAPGKHRVLRAAWVRFPGLEVRAVDQEYTRLDAGDVPARYRYRNLETGFVGELELAADGLVTRYGPWVRR